MHATAKRPPRFTPRLDDELLFHEVKKVSREDLLDPSGPPSTLSGVIACYSCSSYTRHTFAGRRRVMDTAGNTLYLEVVYRCGCGKERVWGTETIGSDDEVRSTR